MDVRLMFSNLRFLDSISLFINWMTNGLEPLKVESWIKMVLPTFNLEASSVSFDRTPTNWMAFPENLNPPEIVRSFPTSITVPLFVWIPPETGLSLSASNKRLPSMFSFTFAFVLTICHTSAAGPIVNVYLPLTEKVSPPQRWLAMQTATKKSLQ